MSMPPFSERSLGSNGASGDTGVLPRRQENGSGRGFHVFTDGSSIGSRWLELHRTISENIVLSAGGRSLPPLPLGHVDIGGGLFSGIIAGMRADTSTEVYALSVAFAPPFQEPVGLDGSSLRPERYLETTSFLSSLQQNQALAGEYEFHYDQTSDGIFINYSQNNNGHDALPAFHLQGTNGQYGVGYNLSITENGLSAEHVGRFQKHFAAIAKLTEHITVALYQAYGLPAPDRTYILRPPSTTDRLLTEVEESINHVAYKSDADAAANLARQVDQDTIRRYL